MNAKVLTIADQEDSKDLKFVLQLFLVPRISTVIRNLIQRQVLLLPVVVLDLVNYSINLSSVMLKIIYVAIKICVILTQLAIALNNNVINSKKLLNYIMRAVCEQVLFFS